jgi:hypothetical protein
VKVTLEGYDQYWQLDTPDPALVGPWMKAIFDSFPIDKSPRIPIEFRIRIT